MTAPGKKIKVLIVEDSAVVRELLVRILETDPEIVVADCAQDGAEAIEKLATAKPDVITMDIHMPRMDGYVATRRIMETHPVPIVIVTASYDAGDVARSFRALEAGAVAVLGKPPGPGGPGYEAAARKLVETVKAMSEVRVVKRWPRERMAARAVPAAPVVAAAEIEVVAIGASTGGPPALHAILAALPKPFPVPIVIVQHIAAGFVQGLADWLAQCTDLPVHLASHGELMLSGHVYLAPDGCHIRLVTGGRISCQDDEPENGLRPAVSCLFRSVAEVYGTRAAGVLLTGMGRDGAAELKLMREAGAVTIAQDKASAVVNGMPGAAVELDAAMHVCAPAEIAALLRELTVKPKPATP